MDDSTSEPDADHDTSRGRGGRALRLASLGLAAGLGVGAVVIATAGSAGAAPQCHIDLTASGRTLAVGDPVTLSWVATGADALIASWTTATPPFAGTATTTHDRPGTYSYQVTGTSGGHYCGGTHVDVVFTALTQPASSTASTTSAPSTAASTSSSTAAPPATTPAAPTTAARGRAHHAAAYPAQSPTGGSGVAWWQNPGELVTLAVLALGGSVALGSRERLRATLAHRH